MRTFIAIELDPALCTRLELEMNRLRATAPEARWVRRESLHLTLSFLGEIPDTGVDEVVHMLGRLAPVHAPATLTAQGSGTFGSLDRPRVLWAGLTGEQLPSVMALQKDLSSELTAMGHVPDFERFEPHVTLARAKNPRGDPSLGRCAQALRSAQLGVVHVREVVLFSTQTHLDGMKYAPISRHVLGSAAPSE